VQQAGLHYRDVPRCTVNKT